MDRLEIVAGGAAQLLSEFEGVENFANMACTVFLPVREDNIPSSNTQNEQSEVQEDVDRQVSDVNNHGEDLIHVKNHSPHEPDDDQLLFSLEIIEIIQEK